MKKKMCLTVLCTVMCCAAFGATLQRTILSHKGKLTQYDANHWQEAIADAVAGDTVYFTAGQFPGGVTIDKAITLIGAGVSEDNSFWKGNDLENVYTGCGVSGEGTSIGDRIEIAIPGDVLLTSCMFEGLKLRDAIVVKMPVTGLTMKRCQLGGPYEQGIISAEATLTNLTLESCFIKDVWCANFVNPDIHNCYIGTILGNGVENLEFVNCAGPSDDDILNATFVNCLLLTGDPWKSNINTYVNCTYETVIDGSTYTNCWNVEGGALTLTKSQLKAANYVDADGKVIGPLGGPAPFTLIPSQPYVSSSTLTYTKSTKKLNVNVTVKQGK